MESLLRLSLLQQDCNATGTRMHKSQSSGNIGIALRTAKLESREVIRLEGGERLFKDFE